MQNYRTYKVNGFIKHGFRKVVNCTIILHLQYMISNVTVV